ncbi:hypothetical protein HY373_00255 [Candidatus Berkelbacteria bacterium]|nr:hypothetical protein [Candidatus Berkelbacteria bacterium]MBI4029601.1 hypothetical protein [Candidatus Berkelbacteria bacterium]
MLALILINGLIDSINPCAIGVLLFYLALLFTLKTKKESVWHFGLFYILAIYLTYLLIGLGLLRAVHIFGIHNFFGWVAAFLVFLIGLWNLKEYFWRGFWIPILSPLLSVCRVFQTKKELTVLSAIALGFFVALCEFPCSGAIYLVTLAFLAAKETFLKGISYLLLYNLMFVLPLVVIFIFAGNERVLLKIKKWQEKYGRFSNLVLGIMMLILGALLLWWLI